MDLGLFGGWSSMVGALIEAVVFYLYAILLLRVAGKTTVGTARIFDFVSTVAMGTMVGSTIISSSIALTTGLAGLTALVALQWSVAYASSRSGRFYRITTNTPTALRGLVFPRREPQRRAHYARGREGEDPGERPPDPGVCGRGGARDDGQRGGHKLLGTHRARGARRKPHGTGGPRLRGEQGELRHYFTQVPRRGVRKFEERGRACRGKARW